ncbi:MAG: undecaprenyl-phosphate galactose phosphotransferase WbaP [Lentisphaeria bacterium]|nr:undecaprenyl-phosphate galactose phosphotransferase WbaP [Lentisphaeria bacterium]
MTAGRIRILFLMLADVLALSGCWLGTAAVYHAMGGDYQMSTYVAVWPFLFVFILLAAVMRLYHGNPFCPGMALDPVEEMRRRVYAVLVTYLLLFCYLTFSRRTEAYSRVVIAASACLNLFLVGFVRNLVRRVLKWADVGQIPALIAGAGKCGRKLEAELRDNAHFGLRIVGFVDDDPAIQDRLGALSDAPAAAARTGAEFLICCLPPQAITKCMREYMKHFRQILLMTDDIGIPVAWGTPVCLRELAGLEIRNQLLRPLPRLTKSVLEFILACVTIVLLIPVFLVLALVVKLSGRGPVLYRADRLGKNGRPIHVWKFRTMYTDADDQLEQILANDPKLAAEWRANFKLEHDPRITPIGRILRKTSLDELPQFFNVITGELAMIGPRPIVKAEIGYYGDNYEAFSRVKPGITGLWQVSGRNDTGYDKRILLDMWYIRNWSVWLDIHIFFATIVEVVRCRGAR